MKLAHPSRAPAKPGGVPPLIFYIMWYSPIQKGVLKMAFTPEIYPDNWSEIVKAALIRAQGVCELCGVRRGAIRRNLKTDEEYVVYLDVCHRVFYHTWKADADTLVLCKRCHNRFDAKFRKRIKLNAETPIGIAKLYIRQDDRWHLVAVNRVYVELMRYIDILPPLQVFKIHLEINSKVVGKGCYIRTDEGVDVIEEDEVAEGFQLAFDVLPKSLKPLPFLAATP